MRIILIINLNFMNELYFKALKAYTDMLEIHIKTKTKNIEFHKMTEEFYEELFDIAHQIWEKQVDLAEPMSDSEFEVYRKNANKIIKDLKSEINDYYNNNNKTLWEEDMLWSIVNKLEDIEWTSKSFI